MSQQTAEQTDASVEHLLLDLIAWIADGPRSYADVLDAWRTSCPRLPIWEEAVDRGFVRRVAGGADGTVIHVTRTGAAFLSRHGRAVRKRQVA